MRLDNKKPDSHCKVMKTCLKLSEVRVCLAVVNVPGSPVVLVIGGHVLRHVTRLGARV